METSFLGYASIQAKNPLVGTDSNTRTLGLHQFQMLKGQQVNTFLLSKTPHITKITVLSPNQGNL